MVMSCNDDNFVDDEITPHTENVNEERSSSFKESKRWDVFRDPPFKKESGSMASRKCQKTIIKVLKVIICLITFLVVLGSCVISKLTLLAMTRQVHSNSTSYILAWANSALGITNSNDPADRIWYLIFAFCCPQFCLFVQSAYKCFFKSFKKPLLFHFFIAFLMESLHTIGLAILVFHILPNLDEVQGAMLTNSVCFVPSLLGLLPSLLGLLCMGTKRSPSCIIDSIVFTTLVISWVIWFVLGKPDILLIEPLATFLVSCAWWKNYLTNDSTIPFIKKLKEIQEDLEHSRYFTYMLTSLWKCLCFFLTAFFIALIKGENDSFFDVELLAKLNITTIGYHSINILASFFAYIYGKFACKIMIQKFSYAAPIHLTPFFVVLSINVFFMDNNTWPQLSLDPYELIWLLWLLAQIWITRHIWTPKFERMAKTETLFVTPMYEGLLIDQSLTMNLRRVDKPDVKPGSLNEIKKKKNDEYYERDVPMTNSDHISRLKVCATMWHETKEEMMEFLKSVFRLDEDHSARRLAQQRFGVVDPDYYELETHIFFDDAFEPPDHDDQTQVNKFVKDFVATVDQAASEVHQCQIRMLPPKKISTPYGGRLIWTLPGETELSVHLKDKTKIRHRKRWSQVMYMYYLLGHGLMERPISSDRKDVIAENTFLLALDGDIDFQPSAVLLLIDLMKKNRILGAACGRIHPVGTGPLVWYQKFEYAIGHWLQKATEHVVGCVLCSPGCFSLFRGRALMDDNVMKKYTTCSSEARHYIQYDQGEDRWLCTLLLQRGYRVEYSAASDAYTHAPEEFSEFYNQRRRWVPSTIANIMDLLMDSTRTIKINDNISKLYITYQIFIMSTSLLGPGIVFLMLVGSCEAIFRMDNWNSFIYNIIPIGLFILVCFYCKSNIQLMVSQILSSIYALLMTAVTVATVIQATDNGLTSPSTMFLIATIALYFISASLHPQEFFCIFHGILYFLAIPSTFLLQPLYSIINLNDVAWGTREVAVKQSTKELEKNKNQAEIVSTVPENTTNELIIPNWIHDPDLGDRGEPLGRREHQFWVDLIHTYLYPIDENKVEKARIAEKLNDLRNKSVFTFLMLNAIFVLAIFLCQIHKDKVHISWPVGRGLPITAKNTTSEIHTDLRLEPIGLAFLVFFGLLLFIQFVAMLFHRWETILHIFASTELFTKKKIFSTEQAVEIAKEMQKLEDVVDYDDESESISSRQIIQNLERTSQRKSKGERKNQTLNGAFEKSIAEINTRSPVLTRRLSLQEETLSVIIHRAHNYSSMRKNISRSQK